MDAFDELLLNINLDDITLNLAYEYPPGLNINTMHYCVRFRHFNFIKKALELGYPINDVDCYGNTLLHKICSMVEEFDFAHYLLDQGANPLILNRDKASILHLHITPVNRVDFFKFVDRLLNNYDLSSIISIKCYDYYSPLYYGLSANNEQYIKRLFELGVDPSEYMAEGLIHTNPNIRKMFEDYLSLSFVKGAE
jgi:ankyrin repeat protein